MALMRALEAGIPSTKRRRRRRWIIAFVLAALCFVAPLTYYAWQSSGRLQDSFDEADRLDPGWRIEELEARRADVPDDQNSAFVLADAKKLLPNTWPFGGYSTNATAQELELGRKIPNELVPPELLTENELDLLRKELGKAEPARSQILKMIDLPHGRYPIIYAKDGLATPLTYSQGIRMMATLLCYEAIVRIQERDGEGALAACRGILNVEHSIRDEPTFISMLIRWAIQRVALNTLEIVLAREELAEPALAATQRLLEEEEREPMWLIAMRGERALMDRAMQAIQNGDIKRSELPALLKRYGVDRFDFYTLEGLPLVILPGSVKAQRAALLHWNNRMVEITKLPVEDQRMALTELEAGENALPILARAMGHGFVKAADVWFWNQVALRSMIALIAVERYRLAHRRWPQQLADLVPTYLAKVPIDAYDGAPLRYRRFAEGVMVYSVGKDSVDNGGNLDKGRGLPGTDRGFRLWDVARRRQPPAKHE